MRLSCHNSLEWATSRIPVSTKLWQRRALYRAKLRDFPFAAHIHTINKKGLAPKSNSSHLCATFGACPTPRMASWRSGDAADCKSVYTGSIPVLASIYPPIRSHRSSPAISRLRERLFYMSTPPQFRLRQLPFAAPMPSVSYPIGARWP